MSNTTFIEVFVRIVAIAACAGAVVAASFTVDKMLDINNTAIDIPLIGSIKASDIIDGINSNIRQRTEATAAMAIVSGVVIPLGILMVVLRLFKISLGTFGRIIVAADLLLILLAACGFGVAGVLGAVTAKDWSEDFVDNIPSELDPYTGDIRDIRTDTAATAACSLLACGSCAGLLIFIIVLLVRYNKLDYTGL